MLSICISSRRSIIDDHKNNTMARSYIIWLASLIATAVLGPRAVLRVAHGFSMTTTSTIHSIDNIPCREIGIYISTLDKTITLLEATLEGQEKLVDEVLMLDDEISYKCDDKVVREDPYGAVLWPAAQTVSEHITHASFWKSDDDNNDQQQKPTLLELGTGTGLVALAASASNKYASILATDYESVPLKLLHAAFDLNQSKGEDGTTTTPVVTSIFDICDLSKPLPPADIICAADILYEKNTGIALAKRTMEALERGSRVIIGCSPGRPGRPAFLNELQRLSSNLKDVHFVNVEGSTCTGERNSLICGKGSTSISDEPEMLLVALMDLRPDCILDST